MKLFLFTCNNIQLFLASDSTSYTSDISDDYAIVVNLVLTWRSLFVTQPRGDLPSSNPGTSSFAALETKKIDNFRYP